MYFNLALLLIGNMKNPTSMDILLLFDNQAKSLNMKELKLLQQLPYTSLEDGKFFSYSKFISFYKTKYIFVNE